MFEDPIHIGGITPLTTVDFPDRLAAVVFCQGCPWRCRYCHNPHLQEFSSWTKRKRGRIHWDDFLDFLNLRRGFLEGVVFSGGEPTLQKTLGKAAQQVREMGFEIGLHTAGPDPDHLEAVLPWVNWVGMDIKAPFGTRYDRMVGVNGAGMRAKESLKRLLQSGVSYQLRTTVHPALLSPSDLETIQEELNAMGANPTVIQPFRPEGCTEPALGGRS